MKHFTALLCSSTLCFLFGCMQQDQRMMQQMEANKKVAKDSWEAFNQKDAAKAASYYAEDAVVVEYGSPKPDSGRAQIQQTWQAYITAFPDAQVTIESEVAHGDTVVLRWLGQGTNTGSLMEMPPTNKRVAVHGCSVYRIVDGKIVHEWQYWDHASFMRQLGMMTEGASSLGAKKEMKKK